jgi:hypothetical protein
MTAAAAAGEKQRAGARLARIERDVADLEVRRRREQPGGERGEPGAACWL